MKYNTHYDAIPPALLTGTVLDVGCGDWSNQTDSTNSDIILKGLIDLRYCGIDLTNEAGDLFDWEPKAPFDTVLAIHVIEHIPIEKWPLMFKRLISWVKPHGHLVIGVPCMQSPEVYKHFKGPENMKHVVFGINETTINRYLDGLVFFRYRGPYSQSLMCIWRNEQ